MLNVREWQKRCWLAKRISEPNAEIEEFAKPELLKINYQPMSGYTDNLTYGENVKQYQKALVNVREFKGVFAEGDRVYIDDLEWCDLEEEYHGELANYVVDSVRVQHLMITIIFKKIIKEGIQINGY